MTRETFLKAIALLYILACSAALGGFGGAMYPRFSGAWWTLVLMTAGTVGVIGLTATFCERKHQGWRVWTEAL